jgi:hypothetical protein
MKEIHSLSLDPDLDRLESLGRKNGVLYLKKAYFRKRDLIIPLIESFDRRTVLISIGRDSKKFENFEHPQLRSIITVDEKGLNGLVSWSEDLDTFHYVSTSISIALQLAAELAQRGELILFSPYGDQEEVSSNFRLFDKSLNLI